MKRVKMILAAVVMVVATMWGMNELVYAEDGGEETLILGITPTQKGFGKLEPGQTYTDSFKVRNRGEGGFSYKVEVAPYSISNENYDPSFEKNTQYTEMVNWISLDKTEGTVNRGEEEIINYTIKVPHDMHGGAQVATIIVSMSAEDAGGLQTVQRLGYLVYGNVVGEIRETAVILENKIPSFSFTPPIIVTSLVENTGNVYTNAKYTLQVFPLFSDEEVYTNEENPEKVMIFPETKRLYKVSWEGAPQLGIFRVKQTIKIFDEVSVTEKLVFLCPEPPS